MHSSLPEISLNKIIPGFLSSWEDNLVFEWSTLLVLENKSNLMLAFPWFPYCQKLKRRDWKIHALFGGEFQNLLVITFPELDRSRIGRDKYCTSKKRVQRCGKESRDTSLNKQHCRV